VDLPPVQRLAPQCDQAATADKEQLCGKHRWGWA